MNYFILIEGKQSGPFTIGQLRSMWNSGSITSETLYWMEGMKGWNPLSIIRFELETKSARTRKPISVNTWAIAISCVALVFLIPMLYKRFNPPPPLTAEEQKPFAYNAAIQFTTKELKAPSTAKFSTFKESTIAFEGNTYTVLGWVDAENTFGAMLRHKFLCDLSLQEDGKLWQCASVKIGDID